jgi:Tfp pilus assembly PilM family ATPase
MPMFEKKELWTNNIAIIDIWSYKIKIANCKFKKDEIDIVSYSEKRQEQNIFQNGEIVDLKLICENLKIAFKKVDPNNQIKKIIINSISFDTFLS